MLIYDKRNFLEERNVYTMYIVLLFSVNILANKKRLGVATAATFLFPVGNFFKFIELTVDYW